MSTINPSERGGADTVQGQALPAPRLFQVRNGTLDLQTLHPGDPVVVTVLAAGARQGDELKVSFGDKTVSYTVQSPGMVVYDILIDQAQLPPVGAEYHVQWSWRNRASLPLLVYLTDSSSVPTGGPPTYHGSVQGLHMPGLLDAWLVVSPYQLQQGASVVQALNGPMPTQAVSLPIDRQSGAGQPTTIGAISFNPAARAWTIEMNADTDLLHHDLLSISVPDGPAQYCNFAFSI